MFLNFLIFTPRWPLPADGGVHLLKILRGNMEKISKRVRELAASEWSSMKIGHLTIKPSILMITVMGIWFKKIMI